MSEVIRFTARLRYAHTKTGGKRRWFRVSVHPDEHTFRAAANAFRPDDSTAFKEAVACFHPAPERWFYEQGKPDRQIDSGYGGTFRFAAEWIDAEVLAHEAVHAAARTWRLDVTSAVHLGWDCAKNEETFAYLVGDIVQQVADGFYRSGVWPADHG